MRVLIAGGGIGGLALAQGLVGRGIDVVVVEPDVDLERTGGYKLHLGPKAVEALGSLLPAERRELLLASGMGTEDFRTALRDHRGRLLFSAADPPGGRSVDIDRVTLRLVLAEGLEPHLLLGRRAVRYDVDSPSPGVRIELDDGSQLEGDVLVIADGAGSGLVQRLAGEPTSTPVGLVGVAGRTEWSRLSTQAQELVAAEPMLAIGPGGAGLFASRHDPAGQPGGTGGRSLSLTTEPVVIWGFIGVDHLLPERVTGVPGSLLVHHVGEVLRERGWDPGALELVERGEHREISGFRFLAADPAAIAPWDAGPVTALGDAAHAMPPTGGQGAATAVRDAAALAELLGEVDAGRRPLVEAVEAYHQQMREYAAAAVRDSLQTVTWIQRSDTPWGRRLMRWLLPIVAMVTRWVHRRSG